MNVSLLLLTHQGIGESMRSIAKATFTESATRIEVLEVPHECELENLQQQACEKLLRLDHGEGVLVLTDLFGATPSNIARKLIGTVALKIVTGINLSMLMRVLNYPDLSLDELAELAVKGGKAGIQFMDEHFDD